MIISMDQVNALLEYRIASPLPEYDYMHLDTRRKHLADTIRDQFKLDRVYVEDLHSEPSQGRFIWWRWNPGMRPSELWGGPGDSKVVANCNPSTGLELHVYDHELATGPSQEKVVIETVYYRLAGWHTVNRRWVLAAEGMQP